MTRVRVKPGAKLKRVAKRLDDPTPILKQIGVIVLAESQRAFRDQGFNGKRWKPRSVPNVFGIISDFSQGRREPPSRRFESRPVLRDTGRLAQSLAYRVVDNRTVSIGTTVEYAAVHQMGGETESERITSDVQKALAAWLKKSGSKFKKKLSWLLSRKFTDKRLKQKVEARPFLGLTSTMKRDVRRIVGVTISEARR